MQSKPLTVFYRSYYRWLLNGAPDGKPYYRCWGLCTNLTEKYKLTGHIHTEMVMQFNRAGLDSLTPFNHPRRVSYSYETATNICHLNPERIEWVKKHCNWVVEPKKKL
jgi:hypothetical protein